MTWEQILFTFVCVCVSLATHINLCQGTKEKFNHKINLEKSSFGKLKLDSRGHFADIIHLDTKDGIKRLLCQENKILIAFKEFATVPSWRPGQIVLGGSKWSCSLSSEANGQHNGIYARILDVFKPKDDRLDLVIGPVGPFDLLDEASIHFHYDPVTSMNTNSAKTSILHERRLGNRVRINKFDGQKINRAKRGTSNILTDILNTIDWHKNVSMIVPFNYDARNRRQAFQFSLKQDNGSDVMHVATGNIGLKDLLKVPKYFSLDCLSCYSLTSLKYTFDLKIEKSDNKPVLKHFISQVESKVEMHTDFALRFRKEMTLNVSRLFWRTQPKELLRVPIAVVPGLPPVELLVSYDMDIFADVQAAVNKPTVLRNKYVTKGSYVISQTMTSKTPIHGDVLVSNWTVIPSDIHSILPSYANVRTNFKHRMGFNASLVWSGKDVSIKLSPQSDITLKPEVSNQVHADYFGNCHQSSIAVGGNVTMKDAYFHVQAFGKDIWNKYLASGYRKRLSLTSNTLVSECKAKCVGPVVIGYPEDMEFVLDSSRLNLSRNHSQFAKNFRFLKGNSMVFSVADYELNCSNNSCNTSCTGSTKLCSARLVTKLMATAIARLHKFAKIEWPDRYLVVAEGLLELPDFKNNRTSPFREGRAMILALSDVTSSTNSTPSLSTNINKMRRLGQLSVCSNFDYAAIKNISGQIVVIVGVKNEPNEKLSATQKRFDERNIFEKAIQSAGSRPPQCRVKQQYKIGDSYPPGRTIESRCGPSTGRIDFLSNDVSESLYEYPFNDIKFKPEGRSGDWCGSELRGCNSCNRSSFFENRVSWDSCMTRVMTPRLAFHLRKLASIAKREILDLQLEKALVVETSDNSFQVPNPLFFEGRAARLTILSSKTPSKMNLLMNAAICAGFDYVRYTSSNFVDVFVRRQDGYLEKKIFFPSGRGFVSVRAPDNLTLEYDYPEEIANEARQPALLDGHNDTLHVSKYYTISDFKSKDNRDFRLDPALVECLEEVSEEFGRKVGVLPGSSYKTRSINLKNIEKQHPEERIRHRSGQAARVSLGMLTSRGELVKLCKSLIRICQPLLQQQQRRIAIGCHTDSLYIDIRPVMAGEETALLSVWNSGSDDVFKELHKAAETVNSGGPLISPIDRSTTCSSSKLVSTDKPYLSFQLGYPPLCDRSGSIISDFCRKTKQYLTEQASKLQERLSSAAGSDRLPRRDIIFEINACVVDECGGCPGTGPIWDRKVRACSKMIGKYLSMASTPYRDMVNKTAFFNPDNPQSTVHSLACHDGNICIENTQLYSLLMPLITARYQVSSENSVEERLFNNEDNPSPLLELVGQELAMHTSGVVKVYIDTLGDISRIRNVLKVAMVYNENVSQVEFHISNKINKDSVIATLQRKIEIWTGTTCSDASRLSIAPFSVHTITEHRLKRSAERSEARNQAKLEIKNWELEWVSKL